MDTVIPSDALRLAKEIPGLDPEAYTRAAINPIHPPPEHDLVAPPEEDCIGAYRLMQWYWRHAPTDDGEIHAALYVAQTFGIGFAEAWEQLDSAYGEYNSRYSHN